MQHIEQDTCSLKAQRQFVRNYERLSRVLTFTIYVTIARRWPIGDVRASCSQPIFFCLCSRLGLSWHVGSHFRFRGAPGIALRAIAWTPLSIYILHFFHWMLAEFCDLRLISLINHANCANFQGVAQVILMIPILTVLVNSFWSMRKSASLLEEVPGQCSPRAPLDLHCRFFCDVLLCHRFQLRSRWRWFEPKLVRVCCKELVRFDDQRDQLSLSLSE